jgi:hypothetical protein
MTTNEHTRLLATAYDADGDPREWVLHDVTARQAVLVRAFLRSVYGRRGVNVSFLGCETYADFIAFHGEEYEEFLAEGWRRPRQDE